MLESCSQSNPTGYARFDCNNWTWMTSAAQWQELNSGDRIALDKKLKSGTVFTFEYLACDEGPSMDRLTTETAEAQRLAAETAEAQRLAAETAEAQRCSQQTENGGSRKRPLDVEAEACTLPCGDPRREGRGLPRRVSGCRRPCCVKVPRADSEEEDERGDGRCTAVPALPRPDRSLERSYWTTGAAAAKAPHQFAKQWERKRQRDAVRHGIALADKLRADDCLSGFVAMEKYDGYRALWKGCTASGEPAHFTTRQGTRILPPPSFAALLPPDLDLDGELWAGRGQFQRVGRLLDRRMAEQSWAQLTYVVYDAPGVDGVFIERLELARAKLAHAPSDRVLVAPVWACEDAETKDRLMRKVLDQGGEGLMLRRKASKFVAGVSPTRDLLKVKACADAEALIIPSQPGHAKASVRVRCLNGEAAGKEFHITTVDPTTKPPGTVVTFQYQLGLERGLPRHPFIARRHAPDCDCGTCEALHGHSRVLCR